MDKKELLDSLKNWPGDAKIEIAIPVNIHSDNPEGEDKIWREIAGVEINNTQDPLLTQHCLLFAGNITRE